MKGIFSPKSDQPLIYVRSPQQKFDREMRFTAWQADLDAREEDWMKEHPEDVAPIVPATENTLSALQKILPADIVIKKVEVIETMGGWAVLINGLKYISFYGPDAQKRATKKAGELLNS